MVGVEQQRCFVSLQPQALRLGLVPRPRCGLLRSSASTGNPPLRVALSLDQVALEGQGVVVVAITAAWLVALVASWVAVAVVATALVALVVPVAC